LTQITLSLFLRKKATILTTNSIPSINTPTNTRTIPSSERADQSLSAAASSGLIERAKRHETVAFYLIFSALCVLGILKIAVAIMEWRDKD
jgi:hypothetical protein